MDSESKNKSKRKFQFSTFSDTANIVVLGVLWSIDYNNYCNINTNSNVILDGVVVKNLM